MSIPQHCVDDTAAVINRMEATIDEFIVLHGQLSAELVKAQTEGRVHPMVMHDEIFAPMATLFGAAMSTRGAAVEVHRGMNRIAQKLKLERSAYLGGPWDKDNPPVPMGAAPRTSEPASAPT